MAEAEEPPAEPSPDAQAAPPLSFTVVGIGASAGGLDALCTLLARLSADGMAFVVVQHLAAGHPSALTEILARSSAIPVVTASDGTLLKPNTVYVAPPEVDLTLAQGRLRLLPSTKAVPRHNIDLLLRSLAANCGSEAIAVVLSGAGSDGTLGAQAIREQGGIVFAQDPATAAHGSMPQSVIDAGLADYRLSPEQIGDELMRLSKHPLLVSRRARRIFGPNLLEQVFERLRRSFSVDFSAYKLPTIERRLERRMALRKVERAEEYLKLLDTDGQELKVLHGDLLIGVTAFFRDKEPFEALKERVFRRLLDARGPETAIRVWVPGCASGEEAYSVGMCLLEALDGRPAGYKVQIFGTDLDEAALARARQGVYPLGIELDVSSARLQRFFTREDRGYRVAQKLRDMVLFARHNLGKDPPFSRLDLISCRNVLIYMQPALQRRVLRVFHYALKPDAFLLLGTSESVGDASDMFVQTDRQLKLYMKKSVASSAVFDFAGTGLAGAERLAPHEPSTTLARRATVSVQQLADRKVLERFGPPGVLIDQKCMVIQFRGQVGPYLGPPEGAATLSVLKLVRPELLVELRAAIQKSLAEDVAVSSAEVKLWDARGDSAVVLDVMPLHEAAVQDKCLLVLFRDVTGVQAREPAEAAGDEVTRREPALQTLERELLVTKEYLQSTVHDLEGANEELQTANEELQSANEELQSTNEELETSKEELQSTNEELATVNEELQNRISQLATSNDDLQNVLAALSVPVVIVGLDLRIRLFSSAAEKLLNLVPQDIGRSAGCLEAALNRPQIEKILSDTLGTLQESMRRVRCNDGNWYTMRTLPYRTSSHAICGVTLELTRAPPPRRADAPNEISEMVGSVLSTLPQVLMVLDEHLRLVWVNKAFFDAFSVGAEVLGRSLDEIWSARSTEPALWEALESATAEGVSFAGLKVASPFGRPTGGAMTFSARSLPREAAGPQLTLVTIEDVQ